MAQSELFSSQTGKGTDLILLHGWGLNGEVWQSLVPHLAPCFRVHVLDLPGFGDSEWHPEMKQIQYMSARIEDYIVTACSGPAHLVGWSMGGLIATDIALRQPALVRNLVTVASSPRFVAETNWPGIQPSVLDEFQTQLSANLSATLKRFLAVQTLGSPHAREDMKELRQQLLNKPLPHADALAAGLNWLQQSDFREDLAKLEVPLTRYYGRLDTLVPVDVAERITVGEAQVFAHSAHAPFMTESEKFATTLRKRFEQLKGR
ncbi:pimeloyl-ACP methyl ester esterase BioH [Aliidiomarina sp. Khilg15.8]